MSCFHPLRAFRTPQGVVFNELGRYDIVGRLELPCGQCVGCRMRRASDWALRVTHEASLWEANCFVTLTYGRDCVPAGGSLEHRDFQLFMKRLRKRFAPATIRFYMCGEYGPLNLRPHYHACLFNVDFRFDRVVCGKSGAGAVFFDSPTLSELWSHGRVSVQDLNASTASYCARYIMEKLNGDLGEAAYSSVDSDGVVSRRVAPYCAMSLRPGIGALWLSKYHRDVYPHDFVVADGVKRRPPKYYDKLFRAGAALMMESVEFERGKRAKLCFPDSTDERLAVREVVVNARVANQKRGSV